MKDRVQKAASQTNPPRGSSPLLMPLGDPLPLSVGLDLVMASDQQGTSEVSGYHFQDQVTKDWDFHLDELAVVKRAACWEGPHGKEPRVSSSQQAVRA